MALTLITFLRTPLCSTKTSREPAQDTRHGEGSWANAVGDSHPPRGALGPHGGWWHSPGVPALSWYQKARHWAGAEGWYGWDVSPAVCPAGREALPVLTTM